MSTSDTRNCACFARRWAWVGSVPVDRLADEITRAMREYTDAVSDGVMQAVDEIADEGKKELQATSPKKTGKYAKAWTVKKEGRGKFIRRIIHLKAPHYRLAHLLEKGHAKRGGGRVAGRPHIAPVEQKLVTRLEERIIDVIKGGG